MLNYILSARAERSPADAELASPPVGIMAGEQKVQLALVLVAKPPGEKAAEADH
jgi:hypothetical protein